MPKLSLPELFVRCIVHLCAGTAIVLWPAIAIGQACFESTIQSPSPFMGNHSEIFKLSDGTLWEVQYAYEYLYEYQPSVVICPGRGQLHLKGKKIDVRQVGGSAGGGRAPTGGGRGSATVETQIDGEFIGWDGETIFKLSNGQIWQQSSYAYTYHYAFSPKVIIFRTTRGHEMQVEGVTGRILVTRLK